MVTQVRWDSADYAELPARLEGGTPNVSGAVAWLAPCASLIAWGATPSPRIARPARAGGAGLARIPGVSVLAPHATQSALVSLWPSRCTHTTLAPCWTHAALPCAPATTAHSR